MNRREFNKVTALGIGGSLLFGCMNSNKFSFKKNQVIACLGDSVTFANKNGYVELLQKLADEKKPELNLTFLNWGKNSETITGLTEVGHPGQRPYLFERLDELLANQKVDVIIFCYGINCGIYGKPSQNLFDSYKIGVLSFLQKVEAIDCEAILLTPPPLALEAVPIEINTNAEYTWLNPYPEYDKEVIQEFNEIIFSTQNDALLGKIDIHSPLLENQAAYYDTDPIHPNLEGHQLIANTILQKMGF